jgi:hypothetical protein
VGFLLVSFHPLDFSKNLHYSWQMQNQTYLPPTHDASHYSQPESRPHGGATGQSPVRALLKLSSSQSWPWHSNMTSLSRGEKRAQKTHPSQGPHPKPVLLSTACPTSLASEPDIWGGRSGVQMAPAYGAAFGGIDNDQPEIKSETETPSQTYPIALG